MKAWELPKSVSAAASTIRVLPEPVGPRKSRFAIGRPGRHIPANTVWYTFTSSETASPCPTIFPRSMASNSWTSELLFPGSRIIGFENCPLTLNRLPTHAALQHHLFWCGATLDLAQRD